MDSATPMRVDRAHALSCPPRHASLGLALLLSLCGCGSSREPARASTALASPARATIESTPVLGIRVTPVCAADGEPTALDVEVAVDTWDPKPPVFRISNEQNAEAMRGLIQSPTLSDARGEIPLTIEVAADAGSDEKRVLVKGARPAEGRMRLRYRAISVATAGPGIRFGLRHDARGIGGSGDGFLVLPAIAEAREIRFVWAPSQCTSDLTPSSALGDGSAPAPFVGPPDSLRQAGFFFGRPETIVIDDAPMHLRFHFFGRPSFDTALAATYAGDVLRAERAAFGDRDPTPFYAFMRVLPAMGKSVVGGGNPWGYSSVVGPEAPWNFRMRNHIAHELLHHWIGVGLWIEDEKKVSGYWFSEGFTVHYAHVIPLRIGLITPTELLEHVNKLAISYYTSPVRGASNAQIVEGIGRGIGDPALGLMPYWRGALYAAELSDSIRAASKGKRSLDDLMQRLIPRGKLAPKNASGYPVVLEATFRGLVESELGQAGVDRFDAVIRRGELARPPSGAFGPCFERRDLHVGEYQVGFDVTRSMMIEPKAIRGLVDGSSAAVAGLAEGDPIVELTPGDNDSTKEIVVTVMKKGKPVVVRYLPARPGTSVEVLQWGRVEGVADARCAGP